MSGRNKTVPETSTTLLRNLARDSRHARWGEFVARYRPMMEAYMREHFPAVDADEAIQQTFVTLIKMLPVYHYSPEETGHFRNYLTGILRHKSLRLIKQAENDAGRLKRFASGLHGEPDPAADSESEWRKSLMETALRQILSDTSVSQRTRIVFARVAVNGEDPAEVASSLGIGRNAVDQIKFRMMERLKEYVAALEKADGC